MTLAPIPAAPEGVKYALTVPQSVLFTELSLQGNRQKWFSAAMHIDYEPRYVIYDSGVISWNHDNDKSFSSALLRDRSVMEGVRHFVSTMGSTSRAVGRVAKVVASNARRRPDSLEDLLTDLETYWSAYKLHMTNLFTFWNTERLLTDALVRELEESGRVDEIRQGLVRFLGAYETNYFLLEREQLKEIAQRFIGDWSRQRQNFELTVDSAPPHLLDALRAHSANFGFLLTPFNLGAPPSVESLLERLEEIYRAPENGDISSAPRIGSDVLEDLPRGIRELGFLAQQLAFWRHERLDTLALADVTVQGLYQQVSATLSVPVDQLLAMTSGEILDSLREGSSVVSEETRVNRQNKYCLVLHDGKIAFYAPFVKPSSDDEKGKVATTGTVLRGQIAFPGVVTGVARVVSTLADAERLITGEILVTPMTRVEMGAALDRASAWVTDEGGRLSHAAVASREMRKPCIIGTGDSTRLIQSGMVLRVDATNGVVSILDSEAKAT